MTWTFYTITEHSCYWSLLYASHPRTNKKTKGKQYFCFVYKQGIAQCYYEIHKTSSVKSSILITCTTLKKAGTIQDILLRLGGNTERKSYMLVLRSGTVRYFSSLLWQAQKTSIFPSITVDKHLVPKVILYLDSSHRLVLSPIVKGAIQEWQLHVSLKLDLWAQSSIYIWPLDVSCCLKI